MTDIQTTPTWEKDFDTQFTWRKYNGPALIGGESDQVESIKRFIRSLLSLQRQATIAEQKQKLNPEYPDLLPVLTKSDEWYKAHEEMGAEIIFDSIYDEDDGERMRPIKAVYQSPIVKFQEVIRPAPSPESKALPPPPII